MPYFFPGVLSVLLFLAWRGGRPWFQWITLGACVVANVVLLLWIPYTYSGGGGPIGNRYFMGLYPLLLFVTPPLRSALPAIAGLAIGGLFTAKLVLNPFYASYRPAEHVKHGPLRWLPIEKSLLNDLPINVTPERVRIQLAGEPRISAYFLDDNAYPPEGEWFWVKGGSRADLLLRAPVREVTEGTAGGRAGAAWPGPTARSVKHYAPYRLKQLRVEIRTGDLPNVVTVATGADSQTLRLDAHRNTVSTVRAEAGLPYRAHLDQPTSYVYAVSVTSATGFTPSLTQTGVADERFLGVLVRLVPMYDYGDGLPVRARDARRQGDHPGDHRSPADRGWRPGHGRPVGRQGQLGAAADPRRAARPRADRLQPRGGQRRLRLQGLQARRDCRRLRRARLGVRDRAHHHRRGDRRQARRDRDAVLAVRAAAPRRALPHGRRPSARPRSRSATTPTTSPRRCS